MAKVENQEDSATLCTFKDLSTSCDKSETSDPAFEDACGQFQPLYHCDGFSSPNRQHLNGKDLADYIKEVQEHATQRGLEGGREEAVRLAQASLLPHLRSVIDQLNIIVAQSEAAENSGSADSFSLAATIVEQIIGRPGGPYDLDDVKHELRRSISQANRYQIVMNQDDFQYLQKMMRDNGLSWPDHPCIAIESDTELEGGQFRLAPLGSDSADAIDRQAADHMKAFLTQKSPQSSSRTT